MKGVARETLPARGAAERKAKEDNCSKVKQMSAVLRVHSLGSVCASIGARRAFTSTPRPARGTAAGTHRVPDLQLDLL